MMENYDESVEINHNLNWSFIFYHRGRILISGGRYQAKIMCWIKDQRSIWIKQSTNYSSKEEKKHGLKNLKIQKHSW